MMPSLGLITGMVSLTLCCYAYATMPSDKAKCAKPPEIENAILQGNWDEETYPQHHTANYSCLPGYFLHGRIRMICLEGKWEMLKTGKCKKKLCPNPGENPYVTFELKNEVEFVFGAVVEYSCIEGYQMVSKYRTRTCAIDGWTNAIPYCEARLCPPIKDDSVIVISTVSDDEFTYGNVITLKCKNPKDILRGPSKIHCTANGTWDMDPPTCKSDVDPPTCKASCTVQENDMRTHNVQLKDNRELNYRDNEDVQFKCISGYNISDPTELMIKCNNGILKYPACHKIVNRACGRPPSIEHGDVIMSIRNYYCSGSSVKYKCPSLYKLHGHEVITCKDGMWDDPPVCSVPCTTNEKKMSENHIKLMWKKENRNRCERNKQNRRLARKCYVQHNDTIEFACLPKYVISDPKELISKCHGGILPHPTCLKGK